MTPEEAQRLDAADPLAFARERFLLPEGVIYLNGNSLGAMPVAAPQALAETAKQQWGGDLIASWTKHGWIDWPTRIAAKLAPIVGAKPNELLIADSTSVCLFKLLAAAARARPGRKTTLSQRANFPTDLYVAHGLAEMLGLTLKTVELNGILAAIDGIAIRDLAATSRALSQLFIDEVEARCGDTVQLASPRDPLERGSHLVFAHPEGYAVMQALIARGVIGDFRAPDLMRFGFAPLYNRFADMVRTAQILGEIVQTREWDQPRFRERARVT